MAGILDDVQAKLKTLSPEKLAKLQKEVLSHPKWGKKALWVPNPGPQTDAYNSKADTLLFGGSAGPGKALDINTPLPTPTGWTTMGEVQIGNELFNENGVICRVVAATPIMFDRPCYRITFSDGAEIIADAGHQWLTMTAIDKCIRTTEQIFASPGEEYYIDDRRYITYVYKIDSVPVRCIEVDSKSHMYLAGREMIPTHNSDLCLGLAFNEHRRSLVLRRRYADLGALTDRAIEINGTKIGYNGAPPPGLKTVNDKFIQFGANQHPGDEQNFLGRAYDFKAFDESCQFTETQIRLHLGWLRSSDQNQKCRAVLASNPPINADGDWIIGMFRPWLDLTHPNPAKTGELRWYVTAPDGSDLEIDESELGKDEKGRYCYEIGNKTVFANSRTFIFATLADNPFLINTDYQARLDAMPEPMRSAFRDGNFMIGRKDAEYQLIPTQWIMEAQSRWKPQGWRDQTMTAMAFDPAGGGNDAACLMWCYGNWFGQPVTKKGEDTADGSSSAATIIRHRRDNAAVIVDAGGGYGGSVVMRLKDNGIDSIAFNGAHVSSGKTKDRTLLFVNKRAEAWWRFKEALDPDQEGGSQIALPPDAELRSELATPTYEVTARGIVIESKDKLRDRLRRSPNKADACIMTFYASGVSIKRNIGIGSSSGGDPRSKGLPQFAKRRDGPLTRKRR